MEKDARSQNQGSRYGRAIKADAGKKGALRNSATAATKTVVLAILLGTSAAHAQSGIVLLDRSNQPVATVNPLQGEIHDYTTNAPVGLYRNDSYLRTFDGAPYGFMRSDGVVERVRPFDGLLHLHDDD